MYADPNRVREPYARLRLDRYEAKLIDSLVEYTGLSRAELVRQLVLNEAMDVLGLQTSHACTMPCSTRESAGQDSAG